MTIRWARRNFDIRAHVPPCTASIYIILNSEGMNLMTTMGLVILFAQLVISADS